MSGRAGTVALVCLLLAVGGLLWLDYWRQGELELLGRRLDELELARQRRARKPRERTEP